MTDDPKDPDAPNAPPPFRHIDGWGFMTDGPLAPSPVRDPHDPSRFLINQEWGELWEKMTERAIARIIESQKNNPQKPEQQNKYQHMQGMTIALLGGKESWEYWQSQNPSIKEYDFQYFDFFHEINLNKASFNKLVIFNNATFTKKVDFIEAKFFDQINFIEAEFKEDVYFRHAKFNGEVIFKNAIFNAKVSFEDTTFDKASFFIEATFNGRASFAVATFNREALFFEATFAEPANFVRIKFNNDASFMFAIFKKEIYFQQTKFQNSGFFDNARFYGDKIVFSHMILSADSNLVFAGARFFHAVPDFRYLNRIPDIRFHNFSVPSPDKLSPENKWHYSNEDCYRKLKELAIENNNHEYELQFYGYEMDSKLRNFYKIIEKIICNKKWKRLFNKKWWGFFIKKIFFNKKWWVDIVPTRLYKCFSNYGQSIWRPLRWLVVLAIIYSLDWNVVFQPVLFLLSFINNFNWVALVDIVKTIMPLPLFTFGNGGDVNVNININGNGNVIGNVIGIGWISDGKFTIKIIATVFWFLFSLAVRNKFKIK